MSDTTEIFHKMTDILKTNPNSDRKFEADCLFEFVTGKPRLDFFGRISRRQQEKLYRLCEKRAGGYPLQYILGSWDFFDLTLKVGEGVLIPRQDTEDVCLAAFEYINSLPCPNVLDLCSGSGAIALAVKKYCPRSTVVAVEKYDRAYSYLTENIEKSGLCVLPIQRDVFRFDYRIEEESFDVIISNPPYVNPSLRGSMQKEVEFEPWTALFSPDEGLKYYKFISHYYRPALKEGGYLIFEHGYDQADRVKQLLIEEEYRIVKQIVDSGGNPRGIVAKKA